MPAQRRINFSGVYRDNAALLRWLAQATPAPGGKAFAYSNLGYDLVAMAMAPADGLFATAEDLARLLQAMLGQQLPQDREVLGYRRHGHSLGFDLALWHGQSMHTRLGSFRGASSHLSFMHEQGLGIALLTKGDAVAGLAGEQLVQAMYRSLLGEPAAALQSLGDGLKPVLGLQARLRAAPAPVPPAAWPLPPGQLVGRYADEQLGDIELVFTGQALLARWGALESELTLRSAERLEWRVDWSGQGVLVQALAPVGQRVTGLRMFGREL